MDSDSKTTDDDGDSATKQVLDYYKKYSLNKELPKYFSGSSVSYLPEIKDVVENPEVVVKTDINIIITEENKEVVNEELLDTSRASSVMSNRKLEWDNGADIGYNNCLDIKMLRKSSSLPVLAEFKQNRTDFKRPMSNTEQQSQSSSDSNVKIVLIPNSGSSECQSLEIEVCSSSSSAQLEEKKIITTSSSNAESNVLSRDIVSSSSNSDSSSKQRISQFANTLLYLKKKIGLPDAHSTPKFLEGRKSDPELFLSTPVVKKPEKIKKSEVKDEEKPSTFYEILPKPKLKHADKPSTSSVSSLNNLPVVDTKEVDDNQCDNAVFPERQVVKYRNKKVVNLTVTAPITVECVCEIEPEQKLGDIAAKTVIKYTTIGVQTDSIPEQELTQTVQITKKSSRNQSLLFFEYSESDSINARSTQTSSDIVASNCDSFEFFKNSPESKNDLPVANIHSNIGSENEHEHKPLTMQSVDQFGLTGIQTQTGILRRSQKTEDLRTVSSDEGSRRSSIEFCLGNVVSASQVDNLGDDIGKSICLLQKLLKSKKYDPVTKKRYAKKIVQKITESKYLEESSTSSDLFLPKKLKSSELRLLVPPSTLVNTDSSDSNIKKSKSSELKVPKSSTDTDPKVSNNTLQSNLPWCPINDKVKLSPSKKKLVFKTFTQDFLPKDRSSRDEVSSPPEIIPTDTRDRRKSRFTLTNNEFSVNHKSDETQKTKSPCETDNMSLKQQCESSSTSKSVSYENWREDKTLSEKILEENLIGKGSGDRLVQFAERERKYQINWINNEISHLGKLKGLLEKPATSISEQNIIKTTTVYTVSEESDSSKRQAKKANHKFVIETQLGSHTSSDMRYKIGDKKYTVKKTDPKESTSSKTTRTGLGGLEVVSSDNTTNIKVFTFCETCKRSPCVCNIENHEICKVCKNKFCTCPGSSSKTIFNGFKKNDVCKKCKRPYSNTPSTGSTSSSKTICLSCHRADCTCIKTISDLCTCHNECSAHGNYPSYYAGKEMLNASPSDEYAGMFVPADLPKPLKKSLSSNESDIAKTTNRYMVYSTFPYTDKDKVRKKLSGRSENCSDCGDPQCTCHLKKDMAISTIAKKIMPAQSTEEIQSGSLKNVFENCTCTSESKCHCGFVQKLIKHFDIADIPNSILTNHNCDKICQTDEQEPKSDYQNISVQVEMETKHEKLQTAEICGNVRNVLSQTDDPVERDCGHTNTQTYEDTKSKVSQTSDANLSQYKTAQFCEPSQLVRRNKEFQPALVHSISRKEKDKKRVSTAEKGSCRSSVKLQDKQSQCSKQGSSLKLQDKQSKHSTKERSVIAQDKCSKNGSSIKLQDKEDKVTYGKVQDKSDECSKKKDAISAATQVDSEFLRTGGPRASSYCKCCKCDHCTKRHGTHNYKCTVTDGTTHSTGSKSSSDSSESKSNNRCEVPSKSTSELVSYDNAATSFTEESTSRPPTIICLCCKEDQTPKNIVMQQDVNQSYPLCKHCSYKRPVLTAHCYSRPQHVCTCYKPVRTDILNEIKKTVNQLNLQYCTCFNSGQMSQTVAYCGCKLLQNLKHKKGIAYTLTLEDETPRKYKKKKKKPPLQEIRIKVPYNKKKCKDKENIYRKDNDKEKVHLKPAENNNFSKGNRTQPASKNGHGRSLSLQEHLKKNRPEFIDSADYRRQALLTSRSERELHKEEAKLRFLDETINNTIKRQNLFTEQEMKEITRRHYKKLPEIRQRVNNVKEQKLRFADRIITETFARKIRDCVLRGKKDFPIHRNIVRLPKT